MPCTPCAVATVCTRSLLMEKCRGQELSWLATEPHCGMKSRRCLAEMPSRERPTVSSPKLAQGSEGLKPNRSRTGRESAIQKRRFSQRRTPRRTPAARPWSSTPISASETSTRSPSRPSHSPAGRTQGAVALVTPTCCAAAQLQAEKVWPRSTSARIGGPARSLPLQTVPRIRALSSRSPWPPTKGTSRASCRPKDVPKPDDSSGPERQARHTP
mmetsp:Transcript_17179/g.35879  ORF Transcript_17179/g.35879 Transcript_17179/m.35879 type:complete len:214 (-) Transcript_17179:902-1543(-)